MIRLNASMARLLLGVFSLILCVGLVRSLYSQLFKEDAVEQRKQGILKETMRNAELKRKLEEATSSAYIEKLAREKLGLVREGDTVVLLDMSGLRGKNQLNKETTLTNWEAWVRLFF